MRGPSLSGRGGMWQGPAPLLLLDVGVQNWPRPREQVGRASLFGAAWPYLGRGPT